MNICEPDFAPLQHTEYEERNSLPASRNRFPGLARIVCLPPVRGFSLECTRHTADPETKCFMVGTPRINYMPYPFEIVQTPTQITILYEYVHTRRGTCG